LYFPEKSVLAVVCIGLSKTTEIELGRVEVLESTQCRQPGIWNTSLKVARQHINVNNSRFGHISFDDIIEGKLIAFTIKSSEERKA
jgi:hypothetical protein